MSDVQTAYVVTSGEYSDYRIRGVFLDKSSADRYAASLRDSDVEVEEYPTRGPEFVPGRNIELRTVIDEKTGEVESSNERREERAATEFDGQCATRGNSNLRGLFHIVTTADVTQEERARKSHAEHVAKKRAEVMGL